MNLPIAIIVSSPPMSAMPAVVAFRSKAVVAFDSRLVALMFSSIPLSVRIITSPLATVSIILPGWRFVGCRATARLQSKNCLTNTEHKNKNYYRTDSFGHNLSLLVKG